jgi:predicted lipid-binding transport protein (Tim44 family)
MCPMCGGMGMPTGGMVFGWLAMLLFLSLVLVALVISVRRLAREHGRRRAGDGAPPARPSQGHTRAMRDASDRAPTEGDLVGSHR